MHLGKWLLCFWQIKGVLFWKKEKNVLWRVNKLFLISLILHVGFLAGKHPLGTVLTIEQDQDGP